MIQRIAVVPLLFLVVVVIGAVLLPALSAIRPNPHQPFTAQSPRQEGIIAEGGHLDPDDFCRELNRALSAAGVPLACTHANYTRESDHTARVEFTDKYGNTMAHMAVGADKTDLFENYSLGMPKGRTVFTTAVRVSSEYENQGLGTALLRAHDRLLRLMGAQPGDIHLIIASPDDLMDPKKQEAWIQFIQRLCADLNGVSINSVTRHGGCWTILK